MGNAKRSGTLAERIARAKERNAREEDERRAVREAEATLAMARMAKNPTEAEQYIKAALKKRRVAALMAMAVAASGGER